MTGHLYFIGIAGHTMRGLALAARENGCQVSGLDPDAAPPGSTWLDQHNLVWWKRFDPVQLKGVTAIIVTGAHVVPNHPAVAWAHKHGVPVKSYAQLWGEMTADARVVSVAGTHGKTTTTSLLAWLFEAADRRPDFLIGIQPFNFDTSVRFTHSQLAIAEGDEYRASSLETKSKVQYYHADVLVLTAIEHDHPDMYPDLAAVTKRFQEVVAALPPSGQLVAWAESETVANVALSAPCPVVSYGLESGDYIARDIGYVAEGLEFDVEGPEGILGRLAVPLYGRHNILNVLAATVVGLEGGLSFEQIVAAAAEFRGAYRRFNLITEPEAAVAVIDDYAHHPTEVATTIEAAKLHFPDRRLVVVFRPHTYSRTQALLSEYRAAFHQADVAYITDIESAREAGHAQTVSGRDIADHLPISAQYMTDRAKLVQRLHDQSQPGDVVLCMTVSGYKNLAAELAATLNQAPGTTKPATPEGNEPRR